MWLENFQLALTLRYICQNAKSTHLHIAQFNDGVEFQTLLSYPSVTISLYKLVFWNLYTTLDNICAIDMINMPRVRTYPIGMSRTFRPADMDGIVLQNFDYHQLIAKGHDLLAFLWTERTVFLALELEEKEIADIPRRLGDECSMYRFEGEKDSTLRLIVRNSAVNMSQVDDPRVYVVKCGGYHG